MKPRAFIRPTRSGAAIPGGGRRHETVGERPSAADAYVKPFAAAHRAVTGREAEAVGLRIVGDANLYVHGSGVPAFYYGPSNETAHADVEWVSVSRLADAARVYALTALGYCGVAP